jgi:hypothetical protein
MAELVCILAPAVLTDDGQRQTQGDLGTESRRDFIAYADTGGRARGALRFSGPVLGARHSAPCALGGAAR